MVAYKQTKDKMDEYHRLVLKDYYFDENLKGGSRTKGKYHYSYVAFKIIEQHIFEGHASAEWIDAFTRSKPELLMPRVAAFEEEDYYTVIDAVTEILRRLHYFD